MLAHAVCSTYIKSILKCLHEHGKDHIVALYSAAERISVLVVTWHMRLSQRTKRLHSLGCGGEKQRSMVARLSTR